MASNYLLPPLIIQPYIENAIKHGTMPNRNIPGKITILINETDRHILVIIEDNGLGFGKQATEGGDGMRISKERLMNMDKQNEVIIQDRSEQTGTLITLKIIKHV